MSIRHLVVATLLVGAGAAQADVVSSGFQNGWTASDGTSVIGSGVLGNGVSLVGGVAHSANGDLSSALVGKTSASLSQADAQKLFVTQGIDANYVLSAGNGLLAARYGNSVSIINDGDGVKVVPGQNGGSAPAAGGGDAGAGAGGGASAGGGAGSGSGGNSGGGAAAPGAGGNTGNTGGDTGGNTGGDIGGGEITLPGAGPILALPALELPDQVNAVPEPGTIALMLAGLVGAGAFSRRRNAKQ